MKKDSVDKTAQGFLIYGDDNNSSPHVLSAPGPPSLHLIADYTPEAMNE